MKLRLSGVAGLLLACMAAACGGGSVGSSDSDSGSGGNSDNVQPISVSSGPNGDYVNGVFTSVTICTPGTSVCQTIDNILVDTGSFGLRLLGSLVNISLPLQTNSANGNEIGECTVFADGYSWGPVATADIRLANEAANDLPIQLIGTLSGGRPFATAPSDCSDAGKPEDTITSLGVNGILGIGVGAQDCPGCSTSNSYDQYFACDSAMQCSSAIQPLNQQVTNPVAAFASDNNGVVIQLPAIGADGAVSVAGSLIFGIGTRSNNALGAAQILTTDDSGDISAQLNGAPSVSSFIDSGSNAIFFSADIPVCGESADFYCPASTLNESARLIGSNGVSAAAPFTVKNADDLFNSPSAAFDDLAGITGEGLAGNLDFGLPFFFGRTIFFAIEQRDTAGGMGPYFAY